MLPNQKDKSENLNFPSTFALSDLSIYTDRNAFFIFINTLQEGLRIYPLNLACLTIYFH